MKFREVVRFELEYRLRSASTWIYGAMLFGISFVVMSAQDDVVGPVHADAPERLAMYAVAIGIFGILITAALVGDAAVRDLEAGMDPLLYSAPVSKVDYLGGRLVATLVVNAVVLLAIPLGLVTGTLMPYLDPAMFGPFRTASFLQPWLLFLLPNLVFVGALLFTVGVLARQVIPVYLAAGGIVVSFLIAMQALGQIESPVLSVLIDPLGLRTLVDVTEYWTTAERNAELVGFPAVLVWNRVVWLAFAAAILAALHRRFRFAHPDGATSNRVTRLWRGRRPADRTIGEMEAERARPMVVPRVAGSFGARTVAWQTLAVARHALTEIVATRAFLVVLVGYAGFTMIIGWNESDSLLVTSVWPITMRVVESVLNTANTPITFLIITVYAGELVWTERDVGLSEMADATPVPVGAALVGRFLALVAMAAILQIAIMAGGLLTQALQGYYHFEIGLYFRLLLGMNLADLALFAALAMTTHVVVNHKYLGHIVALGAAVIPVMAQEFGILRHHLLLYGTDPGWTYSDMNGFGPFVGPFVWFKLYWAAWALVLGVVAVLFWVRGREPGLRHRLLQAGARFSGPVTRVASVAAVLILLFGGFIFYNTNVLNEYPSTDDVGALQAEYEKRYKRFEHAPQPTLVEAELRIEIYPDEPAVDLRGTYHLVNRTDTPIDSVHVWFIDPDIQTRAINFDRTAEPSVVDDEVEYRIYALERALAPGDSLQLAFDVAYRPRGFPNSGIQTHVVRNGAYFNRSWLPVVGYHSAFELSDDDTRQNFGLDPRPPLPGPNDPGARRDGRERLDADLVHIDAIIGTTADQIAITPGVLRRSWTESPSTGSGQAGRRYFHYVTQEPTPFGATVFSGQFAVREDRWQPPDGSQAVDLRIYHHPTHPFVLDGTLRSMKASLDYYTSQFGPYPDGQLSVVEIPRYGGFGRAHAHTIAFTEDAFLSRVLPGEIDQPFYGTAHEVAHQWWGGQIRGASVRGYGFLSESLANYSALMVTEKTDGAAEALRIYLLQMDRYLSGRGRQSREVPLLEVEGQPYIAYRKGAIAMYTLRDHIGEERVNTALRRFVEKYRDAPPHPTSLDLYAELRAVTPDGFQYLLTDLFETVTLWDVRAERAVVQPTGNGDYQVTVDVVARKMRADSVGNETDVPMDDLIELGVFGPSRAGEGLGETLYLERHRILSGTQRIRMTVPREPARAGIDPYGKLIQRNAADNRVVVKGAQ